MLLKLEILLELERLLELEVLSLENVRACTDPGVVGRFIISRCFSWNALSRSEFLSRRLSLLAGVAMKWPSGRPNLLGSERAESIIFILVVMSRTTCNGTIAYDYPNLSLSQTHRSWTRLPEKWEILSINSCQQRKNL